MDSRSKGFAIDTARIVEMFLNTTKTAVVVSLNRIYQVPETRPWWKQKLTIVGLTVALAGLIIIALVLALYGEKIGEAIFTYIGAGDVFRIAWKVSQWPVSFAAMFLSFSLVYYFAPDIEERRWYWVTPGSAAGVILWLLASLGFRLYLHFFNSYSATYGSLGAVALAVHHWSRHPHRRGGELGD